MRRRLASLRGDTRGVAAPMFAMMGTALVGATGLALDVGVYYSDSQHLQEVTEAAALSAAAAQPDHATGINAAAAEANARAFLTRNGYSGSVLKAITVGRYCLDGHVGSFLSSTQTPASAVNCPGAGNTAVRITTESPSKSFLTRALGGASLIPALGGTATAARIDEAGVGMTSGAVGLDAGLVNTLLSALLGGNIALNQAQLTALLASNVNAGVMFDSLATRVGRTTTTYSGLVNGAAVPLRDLLSASADGLEPNGDPVAAAGLRALAGQVGSGTVPLAGLFDLGVWKNMPVGNAKSGPSLRAGLNAYQLIAYAMQAGGRSATGITLPVSVPGMTVKLDQTATGGLDRPRFSFGPVGTHAGTSALRIKLLVRILDLGRAVNIASLNGIVATDIPLLIDIAAGSATVNSITCGANAATDARVSVGADAGLLNVYFGNLPNDALTQPFRTITSSDITPVTFANVAGIMRVDLKAAVQPVAGSSGVETREFRPVAGGDGIIGAPPIDMNHAVVNAVPAQVGGGTQLASSIRGLQLQPTVCLLGVLLGGCGLQLTINTDQSLITQGVANLLNQLAIDPILTSLVQALGVRAGYADTWVTGVRCGVPVLV